VYWNYLLNQWWLAPAIGIVAGLAAFFAGRRLFFRAADSQPPLPEEKPAPDDPYTNPPASERRAAVRRAGPAVEVDLRDPSDEDSSVPAWVVNRSLGGLCLEVENAIPVGTVLQVRARTMAPSVHPLDVAVRSCRAVGSAWHLSCQFISPPCFNTLLIFG
jgi:hypothetical protein